VFTGIIAVIGARDAYEFISLFPLCLSALFVCAALSLTIMRFMRGKWANAGYSAIWVLVNVALPFTLNKTWETILNDMPIYLSVAVAIVGAAVLVYQISKMISEVKKYAVA
jgi:RsiW-degrading membrane proteinase PrsW (M82 family)